LDKEKLEVEVEVEEEKEKEELGDTIKGKERDERCFLR